MKKFVATHSFVTKEAQEIMSNILNSRASDVEVLIKTDKAVNKEIFYSDDTDLFYCLWEAESESDIHQAIDNSPGKNLFITMCTEVHHHLRDAK